MTAATPEPQYPASSAGNESYVGELVTAPTFTDGPAPAQPSPAPQPAAQPAAEPAPKPAEPVDDHALPEIKHSITRLIKPNQIPISWMLHARIRLDASAEEIMDDGVLLSIVCAVYSEFQVTGVEDWDKWLAGSPVQVAGILAGVEKGAVAPKS